MVTFGNKTNTTSLNFTHTNDGNLVLVYVCSLPSDDISVDTFDFVETCSIGSNVSLSLFQKSTSDADVSITVNSTSQVEKLISVCSLVGVTSGIFKTINGAGQDVTQINLNSFSKVAGITMGAGAINNVNAYATNLSPVQTIRWDYSGSVLRTEAISASLNMDIDPLPVENKISEPSDYAIIIIGVI